MIGGASPTKSAKRTAVENLERMSKVRESEKERRECGTFDGGTSILDSWSRPSCEAVHDQSLLRQQTNQSRSERGSGPVVRWDREGSV